MDLKCLREDLTLGVAVLLSERISGTTCLVTFPLIFIYYFYTVTICSKVTGSCVLMFWLSLKPLTGTALLGPGTWSSQTLLLFFQVQTGIQHIPNLSSSGRVAFIFMFSLVSLLPAAVNFHQYPKGRIFCCVFPSQIKKVVTQERWGRNWTEFHLPVAAVLLPSVCSMRQSSSGLSLGFSQAPQEVHGERVCDLVPSSFTLSH